MVGHRVDVFSFGVFRNQIRRSTQMTCAQVIDSGVVCTKDSSSGNCPFLVPPTNRQSETPLGPTHDSFASR